MLNAKRFLVPNSITSMAAVHIKTYESGDRSEYQFRLADCNRTVKIWGKLDDPEQIQEGIEKMQAIIQAATALKDRLRTLQILLNSL